MFCANTRPVPVASTDFGEISPVIVSTRRSGRSTAGGAGTVVVVAVVVVAVVDGAVGFGSVGGPGRFVAEGSVACAPTGRVGAASDRGFGAALRPCRSTTAATTTTTANAMALARRCSRVLTHRLS